MLEILKLIYESDHSKDDLDWIADKFIEGFQGQSYDELNDLLDSLKREHLE